MARREMNNPDNIAAQFAAVDRDIADALREVNIDIRTVPNDYLKIIRQKAMDALKSGEKLDAAALLRKSDFDALGLPYTKGQITRDPAQFAAERNLRATDQGADLLARFDFQNRQLQDALAARAAGAQSPYQAGSSIIGDLGRADAEMKAAVDSAYARARDHLGRAAPMDSAQFSREANLALDENMLGHYLPAEVRNILNEVTAGRIPFNVNTAVQIDSTLSAAQRAAGNGSPQALAIGRVRDALNRASIADNVGADAKRTFDAARGLARERFAAQEGAPALGAVAQGDAIPDNFVRNYILSGNVDDLRRTVRFMSPESIAQIRAQIGTELQRGAQGENAGGNKPFAPERFAQTLRRIGDDRLAVFFSPREIEQFHRLARVGAYINATPSAAPVLGNPNMAWAADMIGRIPGLSSTANFAIGAGKAAAREATRQRQIQEALAAKVPAKPLEPTAEQKAEIARLLAAGTSGLGLLGGASLRP
jgi:hypothetical protein